MKILLFVLIAFTGAAQSGSLTFMSSTAYDSIRELKRIHFTATLPCKFLWEDKTTTTECQYSLSFYNDSTGQRSLISQFFQGIKERDSLIHVIEEKGMNAVCGILEAT